MIQLLSPQNWKDYELIDCGNFEKLERFGNVILIRPEPQAVWAKKYSESEWTKLHHIRFRGRSATSGDWIKKDQKTPDRWHIVYKNEEIRLQFRLALTSFKHVGIFPEQAVNWDYISKCVKKFKTNQPKVLNLFAYTGGASLAAKAAGADAMQRRIPIPTPASDAWYAIQRLEALRIIARKRGEHGSAKAAHAGLQREVEMLPETLADHSRLQWDVGMLADELIVAATFAGV